MSFEAEKLRRMSQEAAATKIQNEHRKKRLSFAKEAIEKERQRQMQDVHIAKEAEEVLTSYLEETKEKENHGIKELYYVIYHEWGQGYKIEELKPGVNDNRLKRMYCYVVFNSIDGAKTWTVHNRKGYGFIQQIIEEQAKLLPKPESFIIESPPPIPTLTKRQTSVPCPVSEIMEFNKSMGPGHREKMIQKLFNYFDKDDSGYLEEEEMDAILVNKKMTEELASCGVNISETKQAFQNLDTDGDGKISLDEFRAVLNYHSIDVTAYSEAALERCLEIWSNKEYNSEPLSDETEQDFLTGQYVINQEMRHFLIQMNQEITREKKENGRKNEFDDQTKKLLQQHNIPINLNGNSRTWWGAKGEGLLHYSKKAIRALEHHLGYETNPRQQKLTIHSLIGFFVRINYELRKDDNISAFFLDKIDPPRILFRSGTMVNLSESDSVFRQLIKKANLRRVVNLYAGPYPLSDIFEQEKEIIEENNGTYHDERKEIPERKWRYRIQKEKGYNDHKEQTSAREMVATVIKDILLPNGEKPNKDENVLVHCGGGMHRTGMIVGIIRKVFSSADMEKEIIPDYRKHVGFQSLEDSRGREPLNERFIQEFPSELIQNLEKINYKACDDKTKYNERGYLKRSASAGKPGLKS